jgi:hypothetical protein
MQVPPWTQSSMITLPALMISDTLARNLAANLIPLGNGTSIKQKDEWCRRINGAGG